MALYLPDAEDLCADDIRPTGRLHDSIGDLDRRDVLDARYEADGYLFFRGLLPPEAVAAARQEMMAPLLAQGVVDEDGRWIGPSRDTAFNETSEAFAGVWPRLFDRPGVRPMLDKLVGEPTVW